ncbi:MAG TPA: DUF6514 family protein [Bacillota bacterium]|nr:DUF6514 family protein [Bacillota bacterium]HOK69652.1 DUF6514 family protein [Bacillota bacterium]HPP85340.1 DUF6514 family protein [Bacillota bacterium]
MRTLIGELSKNYRSFKLRYLLYEECDNFSDQIFFSLLIEKRNEHENDYKAIRNFTNSRKVAEKVLKKLYAGNVTPVGLPYIIEDFIISQYLVNI